MKTLLFVKMVFILSLFLHVRFSYFFIYIFYEGLKVHLDTKGQFTVHHANNSIYKNYFYAIFGFTCLLCLFGGVFLRVYGVHHIGKVMDYPTTNCTVLSWQGNAEKQTRFKVLVTYWDATNVQHNSTLNMPYATFDSKNWTVGSSFKCLYKGNVALDYSIISSEYTDVRTYYWVGFFIPLALATIFAPLLFVFMVLIPGKTVCYPATIFQNNQIIVDNWGPVPNDLRQFFVALLLSYYGNESATTIRLRFTTRPPLPEPTLKIMKAVVSVFLGICLVIGMGMLGFSGWLFFGYVFVLYCLGVFMFTTSIITLGLGIAIYRKQTAPRSVLAVNGTAITYSVSQNCFYGRISKT